MAWFDHDVLDEKKILHRMTASNFMLRYSIAERDDWEPNLTHVEIGLGDEDERVRKLWQKRMASMKLSRKEIEKLLTSRSAFTRAGAAAFRGFEPTRAQIERGLTDESPLVRLAWARRTDWRATKKDVEQGLTDKDEKVRVAWVERTDYTPTPEQVERGLTDENEWVRKAWAERMDYTPTPEQIERGLTDEMPEVRYAWVSRTDIRANEEQTLRGLDDTNSMICARFAFIGTMTERVIRKGMTHPSSDVRHAFSYTPLIENVTPEQIKLALTDKERSIRYNWSIRVTNPTAELLQLGLNDPDDGVRLIWIHIKERIEKEQKNEMQAMLDDIVDF